MWVRRALQRAEPQAPQGHKGRRAGRLLAAGFGPLPKTLFFLSSERPEGEARRLHPLPYLLTFIFSTN
jgi:hypothetical protein